MLTCIRSNDGQTLLITSSDGFCSCLTFASGELGTVYQAPPQSKHVPVPLNTVGSPAPSSSGLTPTQSVFPTMTRQLSSQGIQPSPSPFTMAQPASPARSMSTSSVMTRGDHDLDHNLDFSQANNDLAPSMGSVGSLTAGTPTAGGVPMYTPPQTPSYTAAVAATPIPNLPTSSVAHKRETDAVEEERGRPEKRRRIAPTLVSGDSSSQNASKEG